MYCIILLNTGDNLTFYHILQLLQQYLMSIRAIYIPN